MQARVILWSIVAVIVIGASWFSLSMMAAAERNRTAFPINQLAHSQGVTMAGFSALKPGMQKHEVDWVLLGDEGHLVSQVGLLTTYTWEKDGRLIGVIFVEGRLAGKWQHGLEERASVEGLGSPAMARPPVL